MKKWAVGFMSAYDNELKVEIVEAEDWQSAIRGHSQTKEYEFDHRSSLEMVKETFFNADAAIDVVEVR